MGEGLKAGEVLMRPVRAFLSDVALNTVVLTLLGVSFLATWRGLSDFITAQDSGAGLAGGAGFGALVFAIVFALTLAMYVALREVFRWRNWKLLVPGLVASALYALLALWSVGFGYGFWWSLIAGEAASARELDAAVGAFEDRAQALSARLSAAGTLMRDAARLSQAKAEQEAGAGGSCGVASGVGEGRLYRARMETHAQITTLAHSVRTEWAAPLEARLQAVREALAAANAPGADGAGRRERLQAGWDAALAASRTIAAEAASRGSAYAAQLVAKAELLEQPPLAGQVPYCHDPDLARALRLAAQALSLPPDDAPLTWRWQGGQEGVARAVEQLWGMVWRLPQTLSGKNIQEDRALEGNTLDGRSLIALIAAVAVDFALLVFTFFQHIAKRQPEAAPAKPVLPEPSQVPAEVIEAEIIEREPVPPILMAGMPTVLPVAEAQGEALPGWVLQDLETAIESLIKLERSAVGDDGARARIGDITELVEGVHKQLKGE